jgi:putative addiction module component (TIGR02574 family)
MGSRFFHTKLLPLGRVEARAFRCYDDAMTSTAIEQSVLRLPKPDRAHLVHLLLDSLDDPSDTDIQALWLNAAQRRADEIDSGKVKLVSGEDLERQVQALFR